MNKISITKNEVAKSTELSEMVRITQQLRRALEELEKIANEQRSEIEKIKSRVTALE